MVVVEQYAGCGGINTPSGASGASKQKVGGGEIGGAEKENPARGAGYGDECGGLHDDDRLHRQDFDNHCDGEEGRVTGVGAGIVDKRLRVGE